MKFEKVKDENKITILFLSWRDIKSPKKGGAEVYTHEMLKLVDKNKYRIIHFSPLFQGGLEKEVIDDILYFREGGLLSVIGKARKYYRDNMGNIDFVVDQCNTHRFFTPLWVERKKRIFFIHQLTREIWNMNSKFPISTIGRKTETPFLRLSKNDYTMTVSNSTKNDLINVGFNSSKVFILPEGIDFENWEKEDFLKKDENTFIYVGRFVNYKGIDATIEAYAKIKKEYSNAKLWILGKKDENYIKEKLLPVIKRENLTFGDKEQLDKDIIFFGFVSGEEKLSLMSRSHALLFPSQREGWGLIVTEAAAVGTPSIVYNSPGIIDAVDFGKAGYMCSINNITELYNLMKKSIEEKEDYEKMRNNAYEFSLKFHWKNTAIEFQKFIEYIINKEN